ncbi:class I SAM-dependent methyltransferase [Pararhodospirillum photometricum]|uniref:Ubiquinone/menaquinone biosynthesis C-methyltransferase UbiE n=1 Tax=Pararhodospirillum photometricum DSM 122 TaxID=1150469 RepID=H6SP87_PARPM|nr:class I SAM-dependent methyltransferase [Pararhodospirillum photometricum]CCG09412.1 2-octaprenyl-6-methoxy-1,4-benzoquinone methylase / demethylmenaquinone methyltransferase [Pararhodospirillum photometricum DSM 122]
MSEFTPTLPESDRSDPQRHFTRIQTMFNMVAARYDLMNDLMSGGTHRWWKRRFATVAGPAPAGGRALDLAGGTGDIARALADRGWSVVVCDPSLGMMTVGRARTPTPAITWSAGAGEALPFPDASFDLITVSFGFRNMTDRDAALREALRVLKPGGRFLCLEFSTPHQPLATPYAWYSRHVIPRIAAFVSGRPEAYDYLVESIRAFPDQRTLKGMMEATGFVGVTWENLFLGIAAIHSGQRPA